MCQITVRDAGNDIPESHCDNCEMRFFIAWNRNPVYESIEFCPFCGDDVNEVVDEVDGRT